ncbi:hypothetical protein N665_0767s0013 [Sinapis alba]|nr:hypothetical protein N665_0767s0013 [Sinapis alba]
MVKPLLSVVIKSRLKIIGFAAVPTHKARSTSEFTSLTLQRREQCCVRYMIISAQETKGVSLAAINSNGWTPLMIAGSWHRHWLEGILNPTTDQPQGHPLKVPYLSICLPVMSIIKIALLFGWRGNDCLAPCHDPFPVCMERKFFTTELNSNTELIVCVT